MQTIGNIVAPQMNAQWLDQMQRSRKQQVGNDDAPRITSGRTRTPYAFPWHNLVRYGLGWPLGIAAWLGWAGRS